MPALHLTQTSELHGTWPSNVTPGVSPAIIMAKSATSVGKRCQNPMPSRTAGTDRGMARLICSNGQRPITRPKTVDKHSQLLPRDFPPFVVKTPSSRYSMVGSTHVGFSMLPRG